MICSILLPEKIWIASGSKSFVKTAKLKKFRRREIILYPDADGFDLWKETAHQARLEGLDVKTSALTEKNATNEQKAAGIDLADYLIAEQLESPNKQLETLKNQQNKQTELPKISVSEFITRLQMSGVEFHISPGFFETGGRALTTDERENLRGQAGAVLCHLQQAALNHFIFKHSLELKEHFEYEVQERTAIISESNMLNSKDLFSAVRQISLLWFNKFYTEFFPRQ